ncbi:MAG: hypothetical protein ACOY5R_10650 [Pseudomonadota bacterium]
MEEVIAKRNKPITSKQMGDACEMLVVAELTLAGIPAHKMPDNWPHYDVIARLHDGALVKISVKSRTYKSGSNWVDWHRDSEFDFLAAVILDGSERSFYLIPRDVAEARANRPKESTGRPWERWHQIDRMDQLFADFKDNFTLSATGNAN